MLEIRFNTCRHIVLDQDSFERLNRNSDTVVAMASCDRSASEALVLDLLKIHLQIVLIVVSPIEEDISFFHIVQELPCGIG